MIANKFLQKKGQKPSHIAYNVVSNPNGKDQWVKSGAAWPIKDNGLKLQLNSVPLSGEVVLRDREVVEKLQAERKTERAQNMHVVEGTVSPE